MAIGPQIKKRAKELIDNLLDAGLKEINFSTGDEHALFVPLETVSEAVAMCAETNAFSSIVINIEDCDGCTIDKEAVMSSEPIKSLSTETQEKIWGRLK